MAHMVFCVRNKKEMEAWTSRLRLGVRPEDFQERVQAGVGEWVDRQKMLLNEYRLQPWTPSAQQFLVEQMEQFFFGEARGCLRSLSRPRIEEVLR